MVAHFLKYRKFTPSKTGNVYTSNISISSSTLVPSDKFVRGTNLAHTIRDSAREIKTSTLGRLRATGSNRDSAVFDGNYSSSNSSKVSTMNTNVSSNKWRAKCVILVDKAIAKKARPDPDSEVELLATSLPSLDQIRDAFKQVVKNFAAPSKTAISLPECERWAGFVTDTLDYSALIAELITQESVSVLVALESGWDMTAVLVALAQIAMDAHYRTFEGFRTLVEREFLSFGHRFYTNSKGY